MRLHPATAGTGSRARSSAMPCGCTSVSHSASAWWWSCWPRAASSSAMKLDGTGRENSASLPHQPAQPRQFDGAGRARALHPAGAQIAGALGR